ncbi:response regulator transcription factor [bacterium]|jgi:DNA-binding response OmpR family regulator|nr:response regulator transcription factor [bacterium]MBT6293268.1 response regulator transcription factor [bacterium]
MINVLVLYFDFVSSNLINFLVSSKYSFFVNQLLSLDVLNFSNIKFDLALLFLPKHSNIDFVPVLIALLICSKPVLVLDPLKNPNSKKVSENSGAVAYFSYPVSIDLIDKTILKILASLESLIYMDLRVNTKNRLVTRANKILKLRKKEFDILTLLLRFPNKVLTKEFIYKALWDINYSAKTNTLEVHISSMRKKINQGFDHSYIKTVNCIGYKLI